MLGINIYRPQFNLGKLRPSTISRTIDDYEQADTKNFSPRLCTFSPSQILFDRLAGPHYGVNFNTAQVSPFTQSHDFMSWHYQVDWTPSPAQGPQSDHEIYYQPVSPAEEGSFRYWRHATRMSLSQNYSNSIFPSSPVLYDSLMYPDNPQFPIEQREENIEGLMPPFSPILEDLLDSDDGEESDYQEPDLDYSDERSLATSPYARDDVDFDQTAPYAVLIHHALMSAPKHRMVLAEIYTYFREKIPRFKNLKSRGWMNSIRHNLSMNGAFLKEERPLDDPGKGFIWVLSEEAIRDGIKSTTRYRKYPPNCRKQSDDALSRGNQGKRRRKSSRKWPTAKSRPRGKPTTRKINNKKYSTPPTPTPPPPTPPPPTPPTPLLQPNTLTSPAEICSFDPIDYSHGVNNAYRHCPTDYDNCYPSFPIDYDNCYPSFPHSGTSNTLYEPESEDESWRLFGPDGQFAGEYAHVMQN